MKLRNILFRDRGRSRSHGRPGGSAAVARRPVVRWWQRSSWRMRAMWFVVLSLFGGVMGVAGVGTFTGFVWGVGVTAGALSIALSLILVPGVVASFAAVLVGLLILPFVAAGYASATGQGGDVASASVSLFIAFAVAVFVGLRFGRGRAWVTAAWVSAGLLFPGLVLVWAFPGLGLNAARLSLLLVVLVRCGVFGWIAAAVGWLWDRVRHGRDAESWTPRAHVDPADVSAAWRRRAGMQRCVAEELASLPPSFVVFHDVRVRKSEWPVEHVVVGPTGVSVIGSVQATGDAFTDSVLGVQVPGADVGAAAWALFNAAGPVRRALGVHPRDIQLLLVVHDANMERTRVAVIDLSTGPAPLTEAVAVDPGSLAVEIQAEFMWWSEVKVRQVARRGRLRLSSAVLPVDSPRAGSRVHVSPVDMDGNVTVPAPNNSVGEDTSSGSGFMERPLQDGDVVLLETTSGTVPNMEVSGEPFVDANGVMVVRIRNRSAVVEGRTVRSKKAYVFPLASVRRDPAAH